MRNFCVLGGFSVWGSSGGGSQAGSSGSSQFCTFPLPVLHISPPLLGTDALLTHFYLYSCLIMYSISISDQMNLKDELFSSWALKIKQKEQQYYSCNGQRLLHVQILLRCVSTRGTHKILESFQSQCQHCKINYKPKGFFKEVKSFIWKNTIFVYHQTAE